MSQPGRVHHTRGKSVAAENPAVQFDGLFVVIIPNEQGFKKWRRFLDLKACEVKNRSDVSWCLVTSLVRFQTKSGSSETPQSRAVISQPKGQRFSLLQVTPKLQVALTHV